VFEDSGRVVLDCSDEYHRPYSETYVQLMHERPSTRLSFVCHYMLFDAQVLSAMHAYIESIHNCQRYEAVIQTTDRTTGAGFSEFEIYGNFLLARWPERVRRRYWLNKEATLGPVDDIEHLITNLKHRYRSLSFPARFRVGWCSPQKGQRRAHR
jgi:hypothetical protein